MTMTVLAAVVLGSSFTHDLTGQKPWTDKEFLDDPQEFHFAVMADRTGAERPGFFGKAIGALNLLRPSFVMSVGDLIDWGGSTNVMEQWAKEAAFVNRLEMPFFHVVGNHDIVTGVGGNTPCRQRSIDAWKKFHGERTYYSFLYRGCQFICLDSMEKHEYWPPREPLSAAQIAWATKEIESHPDARWRFIFMHKPIDWTSDRWLAFERKIAKYDYTVFCGDWHNHCTAVRNGKKYYMIGTAGGCLDLGVVSDDLRYGIMDSITWVTMTKKGPVVSTLALSGIHGDTVQTCATTKGWLETPLDRPSHRQPDPAAFADERNTAVIPKDPPAGDGYDWHFRHAYILRQGLCDKTRVDPIRDGGRRRVILLGDETASAKASEFDETWYKLDFGFKGDRIENVLWRVIEGELDGYEPAVIVLSVGGHNRGVNTPAEIAEGLRNLERFVRSAAPKAELRVVR